MINISVTNVQQAKDAINQELKKLITDKAVLVGIQEDAGMVDGENFTMAALGATLHFGTMHIPPRPWLDVGVRSGSPDYIEVIENSNGELDKALEIIGQIAVGKVQQYMTDLRDPPNAPSTIKKKGSSNPLIDTGALRQSVTYKIETGLPNEGIG